MFILPGARRATISASDLRAAAACEWAVLREFDAVLGRADRPPEAEDPLLARTSALGLAHEQSVLRELSRDHPGRVAQIARPPHTAAGIAAAAASTAAALAADVDVIYQAAFTDDRFLGFADFVVRDDARRWQVWDTKLARTESVASLLQLALYAERLRAHDVPVAPTAVLILGNGDRREFPLDVIVPVAVARRDRLLELLDGHQDGGMAAQWGAAGSHACGRCAACDLELRAREDVLLVAGVHTFERKRLLADGVATMRELAERAAPVADVPDALLARLRAQARLQLDQARTGTVSSQIIDPQALAALPTPSPGDIFFDFEGDPMWREPGSQQWGLEYLFGVIEAPVADQPPLFRAFWAHDRGQEKQALADFLAYLAQRRIAHPDLHIYHYAAYEKAALLRLAARHGVGEQQVDDLLRHGVLVDLYAVVRASVRVSQESYSLKKLEPLYMGTHLRSGPVATAGDSVVAYHEYVQAQLNGRTQEAAQRLAAIRSYNEYDCLSTLRLRDWLLDQAAAAGVPATPVPGARDLRPTAATEGPAEGASSPVWQRAESLERRLREVLGARPEMEHSDDEQAVAVLSATLQYHRREQKPFWWQHFDRLRHPVHEWAGQADVFSITASHLQEDWATAGRQRSPRRRLELTGRQGRGSRQVRIGDTFTVLYDTPPPPQLCPASVGVRVAETSARVSDVRPGPDGQQIWIVEEALPGRFEPFAATPLALVPGPPPGSRHLDNATAEVAESVLAAWPQLPESAGLDLLRRRPPRLLGGVSLPSLDGSPNQFVTAVRAATRLLDRSYLAVQGPPGTGKTYVAAQVIADLVGAHGWKIGVVAQSHAAVENVLDAVVRAGLPGDRVGKHAPGRTDAPWRHLAHRDKDLAGFAAEHADAGYLLGGTAYDFTHPKRCARGQLDLLVIEEAGQYSLANTVAVSVAAQRLLLLGDPQQLGEVSKGVHPEPAGRSGLGWLIGEQETLDPAYGYFLATTYRMHPRLAERISRLAYGGCLAAHEGAGSARSLAGIEPGVHVLPVPHRDNTVESAEEAHAIAARIHDLLGTQWCDPDEPGGPRALRQSDIRVVALYNAQVDRLRETLDAAGLREVPVGTVDRFQGQEAVIVFVSMAASARSDVSRGLGFLLNRNRLNVALSRGKWAAYVVHSPELTDFTPASPRELLLLGAFLQLTAAESTA